MPYLRAVSISVTMLLLFIGAFSPITGDHLLMELPVCNTECFQIFLEELSSEKPKTLIIMVLDNGSFHKAKKLKIPNNIKLVFLPPYSPELNPAEKMWARLKRAFTNKLFKSMEEITLVLLYLCNLDKYLFTLLSY